MTKKEFKKKMIKLVEKSLKETKKRLDGQTKLLAELRQEYKEMLKRK